MDIKFGLLSSTVLRHLQIYCRYDYYIKLGLPVCEAAINTGDDLKVSERAVYTIKKQMESEI
jgi:hypothetical protein